MKINNKGFTLVELMITVAIVGILGAIAVPAYQDYTIRAQVTEGLSLASGAKVSVAEYYANHGEFPQADEDIGYNGATGSLISKTEISTDGEIRTIFSSGANAKVIGKSLSLFPWPTENENLKWDCEGTLEEKYMPTGCGQQAAPEVTTESQTVSCADGMMGSITQERSVTSPTRGSPSYGDWNTISNSCYAPPPTVVTETRTQSCAVTQTGIINQSRTVTTTYLGVVTETAWKNTSSTCVTPPPVVTNETESKTCTAHYNNGKEYSGNATRTRAKTVIYGVVNPTYGGWTSWNISQCKEKIAYYQWKGTCNGDPRPEVGYKNIYSKEKPADNEYACMWWSDTGEIIYYYKGWVKTGIIQYRDN